ncbi:MAG: hypothetical protein AB7P04_10695 [Bacteriovoracia bacterium]
MTIARAGLISFFLFFGFSRGAVAEEWQVLAERLTGESDAARAEVVQALRDVPDLQNLLFRELSGMNRPLALDVIAALGLKEFIPELKARVASDADGLVTLALNTLAAGPAAHELAEFYRAVLETARTGIYLSPVTRVILLDTLGRFGGFVDPAVLQELLVADEPEVRSAVLYYSRFFWKKSERAELLPLAREALFAPAFQLRLQVLSLLPELPPAFRSTGRRYLDHCLRDPHAEVRAQCRLQLQAELTRGWGRS